MRDDSAKHAWKREATFDTEEDARAYIETVLNITMGALEVESVAGTTPGYTSISVTPGLTPGYSYKYKTGQDLTIPAMNATITTGYTPWNGEDEIPATTGDDILIVEVDVNSKAKKAGIAEVVAAEE